MKQEMTVACGFECGGLLPQEQMMFNKWILRRAINIFVINGRYWHAAQRRASPNNIMRFMYEGTGSRTVGPDWAHFRHLGDFKNKQPKNLDNFASS
jgi:hypothetical protein